MLKFVAIVALVLFLFLDLSPLIEVPVLIGISYLFLDLSPLIEIPVLIGITYGTKLLKMREDAKGELLKTSQELYVLRVAKYGEENESTIRAGIMYATYLVDANRGDEARELLKKLLATSKQVLGPRHNLTEWVELILNSPHELLKNKHLLAEQSKQFLGPHHNTSEWVELSVKWVQEAGLVPSGVVAEMAFLLH